MTHEEFRANEAKRKATVSLILSCVALAFSLGALVINIYLAFKR